MAFSGQKGRKLKTEASFGGLILMLGWLDKVARELHNGLLATLILRR